MTNPEPLFPWDDPGWLDAVTAWVDARLADRGRARSGPVEVMHRRTWSAFARVPLDGGGVYFKAAAPALRHEIGLTSLLAARRPDCIAPVLAADPDRGWLLSEDRGETLRSRDATPGQLALWDDLLPLYAGVQLDMIPAVPAMLAAGVPDSRLSVLPDVYANLLSNTAVLRVGLEGGLARDEHMRLVALTPRLSALCAELAAFGIPETIAHEEVHDANVLVNGGGFTFIDWSDCSISHPFISLLVILRAAAYRLKLDETSPRITHLRDVYLDAWSGYAPPARLRRAADIAYVLGMVCRSLSYYLTLGRLPDQYRIENDSIHGWLQDFLEGVSALDG